MTKEEIIAMARRASIHDSIVSPYQLERFAALVAAHVRKQTRDQALDAAEVAIKRAIETEREKSLQLWMLLDDVDTADDIAKADDTVYRSLCRQAHQKRWNVLTGDEVDSAIRARSGQ